MSLTQITVPFIKNFDYGIGTDVATGSPKNVAVTGEIKQVIDAGGAITSYNITRINSSEDLQNELGINVEASYGCASFGAGISARFDFAKKSKIHVDSLFLAVAAQVELTNHSIYEPTLTKSASDTMDRYDVFSERYGNMFVRGIGRGGLFVGVIQINTTSSVEANDIAGKLCGAYGAFSAEASAKFKEIQEKYGSEIKVKVHHEGGPIDLIQDNFQKPDELLGLLRIWLKSFQEKPHDNAIPYYATLAPISIANGPIPPNLADIQLAQDTLVMCAKKRSEIWDKLNRLEYIADNLQRYDFAEPTTPADIVKAVEGYEADLVTVAHAASQAMNDIKKAQPPSEYAKVKNIIFPQGFEPNPMPTLKKGEIPPPPETLVEVPQVVHLDVDEAEKILRVRGLIPERHGSGVIERYNPITGSSNHNIVQSQSPLPSVRVKANTIVQVYIPTKIS